MSLRARQARQGNPNLGLDAINTNLGNIGKRASFWPIRQQAGKVGLRTGKKFVSRRSIAPHHFAFNDPPGMPL